MTTTTRKGETMTEKQIRDRQAKENVPYDLAAKIRKMLDEAKSSYKGNWNDDEIEVQVCELVFEE